MNEESDRFLNRMRWVFLLFALVLVLWQFLPWLEERVVALTTEPRAVTARGELAAEERATIEIFERASPSVVFISTRQRVMNLWTRNIASVPRGNGSGMIWDRLGHVVTNNHVVEGAAQAIVRFNDGRSYRATLIGASPAHDLAVLRIKVPFDRPPPVRVGRSATSESDRRYLPSATPSDWTIRYPAVLSRRSTGRSPTMTGQASIISSRPMPPSTQEIRVARCWTVPVA